jgi:phosphoribosylanthranilate isomerase
MGRIFVQIYEIQNPAEAEAMVRLGVDRIGSVLVSKDNWKIDGVRDTVRFVRSAGAVSSLIPLFSDADSVFRVLDWYEPDVIHFCESLSDAEGISKICGDLIDLQEQVKQRFPDILIQRSIPIGETGHGHRVPTLELARMFERVSDQFLTDTVIFNKSGDERDQPVGGFVGITGITCDWDVARKLIEQSSLPVILAGGLSPDNVYAAAVQTEPYGVDSCTRTNATDEKGTVIRFKKDMEKVTRFIEETRRAEQSLIAS